LPLPAGWHDFLFEKILLLSLPFTSHGLKGVVLVSTQDPEFKDLRDEDDIHFSLVSRAVTLNILHHQRQGRMTVVS
jgi:hypothetical protein